MIDPAGDATFTPLPPQPAPSASYADRDYYRRRIDELLDERTQNLGTTVDALAKRVNALDSKLNRIFGGLAVIVMLASLIAPVVVRLVTGQP